MTKEQEDKLVKDIATMTWENHLQTIFLFVGFVGFLWGISTITDLKNKLK